MQTSSPANSQYICIQTLQEKHYSSNQCQNPPEHIGPVGVHWRSRHTGRQELKALGSVWSMQMGKYGLGWKCCSNGVLLVPTVWCVIELFKMSTPCITCVSGQFRRPSAVRPDCLGTHLPHGAVLPQSHSGLSDLWGLRPDGVHRGLHFLYAGRLERR